MMYIISQQMERGCSAKFSDEPEELSALPFSSNIPKGLNYSSFS